MRKGLFTGAALALLAVPAFAQEQAPRALVVEAANVTATETGRATAGGSLLPGDVVEYRLHFTNVTDAEVRNVVFNDPVPSGLVFVPGTATADRPDVLVEYSLDDGLNWAAEPTVEVAEDGRTVVRPAPPEAYTHVRWTVTGAVPVGARVTASFRARVPDASDARSEGGNEAVR